MTARIRIIRIVFVALLLPLVSLLGLDPTVSAQSTIMVNFAVNYGDGTPPTWYNGTILPVGSTAFNATIAKVQVDYSVHPQFGIFVNGINGVNNDLSAQYFWALWVFDLPSSSWLLSDVGASSLVLQDGDVFMWFYEYHGIFPPLSPETTITISLDDYFIARGRTATITGFVSQAAETPRNVTIQFSSDGGATWNNLATITTATNGAFSYEWEPTETGDHQIRAVSGPFQSNTVTLGVSPCLIATAAYGSAMAPEVQFLREFRDTQAYATFLGRNFMQVFHAWYYSFSPTVAASISESEPAKTATRIMLWPLISTLRFSTGLFGILKATPEIAILFTGMLVSFLIGEIYGSPLILVVLRTKLLRQHIARLTLTLIAMFALALLATVTSALLANNLLAQVSTSLTVVLSIALGSLLAARTLTRFLRL